MCCVAARCYAAVMLERVWIMHPRRCGVGSCAECAAAHAPALLLSQRVRGSRSASAVRGPVCCARASLDPLLCSATRCAQRQGAPASAPGRGGDLAPCITQSCVSFSVESVCSALSAQRRVPDGVRPRVTRGVRSGCVAATLAECLVFRRVDARRADCVSPSHQ